MALEKSNICKQPDIHLMIRKIYQGIKDSCMDDY